MRDTINDASISPAERIEALRQYLLGMPEFPPFVPESNNHVHTVYSFSPYTPAEAALRAREAGLMVVGSVDHDSAAGAGEMAEAARLLGMGAVTGFECRVFLNSAVEVEDGQAPLFDRKLNNPDAESIAYMTVQGIPASQRDVVAEYLFPIREARMRRTAAMLGRANAILGDLGAEPLELERDIAGRSQFAFGGTVTERHLLAAMAERLVDRFGRGDALVAGLMRMGLELPAALRAKLADPDNPFLVFDLLGLMKAGFLAQIYLVPGRTEDGGECPSMAEVIEFADRIGAIACYAYLGDVTASPTGDKAAEKFEDDFLDELFVELRRLGMPAITYMPPRNTPGQIARIAALASEHEMLEVSGVDINTPRQLFNCPELRRPELSHLNEATWAMVAHEQLADADISLGLFSAASPLADAPLSERVESYARLGRGIVEGEYSVDEAVRILRRERQ